MIDAEGVHHGQSYMRRSCQFLLVAILYCRSFLHYNLKFWIVGEMRKTVMIPARNEVRGYDSSFGLVIIWYSALSTV